MLTRHQLLRLFVFILLICLPGIFSLIPMLELQYKELTNQLDPTKLPSLNQFMLISLLQSLILVAISASLGLYCSNKTQLIDKALVSLATGARDFLSYLKPQILKGIVVGFLSSIIFVAFIHYGPESLFTPEAIAKRHEPATLSWGLVTASLLYGGIVEEVLCRLGLMSIFSWIIYKLTRHTTTIGMWGAVVLAAAFFGVGHLPAAFNLFPTLTGLQAIVLVLINAYGGIVFGWLFWRYGLFAAMVAHMIFHLDNTAFSLLKSSLFL